MRTLLGIPSAGSPTKPFLESLAGLTIPPELGPMEQLVVSGNFVPGQRELIVREAVARDCDLLVMIDDDMVVPPAAIDRLWSALDDRTALVGALYYSRDGWRPMVVDNWTSSNTTAAHVPAFDRTTARAVDGVGFGCVLIDVRKLAGIARPLFGAQIYLETAARRVRLCNEDYLFCERLRAAGLEVRLHGGVRCGHYDRESDTVQPLDWESDEATSHPRMPIHTQGRGFSLAPYDERVAMAPESHEQAMLDYLTVG